jgi:hypothetical protein
VPNNSPAISDLFDLFNFDVVSRGDFLTGRRRE